MLASQPPAQAEPAPPEPAERAPAEPTPSAAPAAPAAPSLARRVLATATALGPGLVAHGLGSMVAGDRRSARILAWAEVVSMAVAAAGGLFVGLSGASRRLSLPGIPLLVGGSGLFLLSWGADIYSAAGGRYLFGAPDTQNGIKSPVLELEAGYLTIHDRQFDYAHFGDLRARVRRGSLGVSAHGQIAADDDNQRLRLGLEHRFSGPGSAHAATDGTGLGLEAALTWHRYGSDGFQVITLEAGIHGRYDLVRLLPSLRGAFAELGAGLGVELDDYTGLASGPASGPVAADVWDLLQVRFAYGVYLGTPDGIHGEAQLYYSHRRDDLAGGLATPGGGNGFLGSFGADATLYVTPRIGAALHLQVGSAYLAGAGIIYRIP